MTREYRLVFPLILLCLSLFSQHAVAATVTAASCSQSDVQTAVSTAVTGDTVKTPGPCSASWSSRVSITSSQGITIDGGGNTTLTTYAFGIDQNSSAPTRITGFIITNGQPAANDYAIVVTGSTSSAAGRIDHNSFPASGGNNTFIVLWGNAPFLIDHNTFTSSSAPNEFIHNMSMGAGSNSGWTDDVTPGGSGMVFIEDNIFTFNATGNPAYYFGASAVQSYNGARTVFRHNTCNMCQIDFHGTPGMIGARWGEVYENTFNTGVANASQSNYIVFRGGSGVIFNNHHTGVNCGDNSCGNISLYEEDSGTWPVAYQVGSGLNGHTNQHATCAAGTRSGLVSTVTNQTPVFIWNNDSTMPVGPDGGEVQLDRDVFSSGSQPSVLYREELASDTCSTTYNYVPFTYPHPLQNQVFNTYVRPQPPTDLTAQVN